MPYDSIGEKLQTVMGESGLPMKEVLRQCGEFAEDHVLDAIRFLVDNDVLELGTDGMVKRKGHKKSRRG